MQISASHIDLSIDTFFEHLFLQDDWCLETVPQGGGDWYLFSVAQQRCRSVVVYVRSVAGDAKEYLGVDLGENIIHTIAYSESLEVLLEGLA